MGFKIKKTCLNLITSGFALCINIIIKLWLTPIIVDKMGVEANAFVNLANEFIMYANLIVTGLNGMCSRFITVAYTKKDYKLANIFYNSAFWGNIILVLVMIIPSAILVVFFELFFNVPSNILVDVKILFTLLFIGFFFQTALPNYDVGPYVSNKLYIEYFSESVLLLLKAIFLASIFSISIPSLWYLGASSLLVVIVKVIINAFVTHKNTPELKIKLKKGERLFSRNAVKELVGSGIWSSISSLGYLLINGLDLIVVNILLGPTAMGILTLSKMLYMTQIQLSGAITRAFAPQLTIDYSIQDKDRMNKNISFSMNITTLILSLSSAGFIVFGKEFFSLWIPKEDASLLALLSSISLMTYSLSSGIQISYNIFNTTNTVKYGAIAQLVSGICVVILNVVLIKTTTIGIYCIPVVGVLCNSLRTFCFVVPFTFKKIGIKKKTFIYLILKSVICFLVCFCSAILVRHFIYPNSWLLLCLDAIIVSLLSLIINFFVIFDKNSLFYLKKFLNKFKK